MEAAAGFQLQTTSVNLVFSAWFSNTQLQTGFGNSPECRVSHEGTYVTFVQYAFKICGD